MGDVNYFRQHPKAMSFAQTAYSFVHSSAYLYYVFVLLVFFLDLIHIIIISYKSTIYSKKYLLHTVRVSGNNYPTYCSKTSSSPSSTKSFSGG